MDTKYVIQIKEILDKFLPANRPTDEELDYDDMAIEVYDCMYNLKEAIENFGYWLRNRAFKIYLGVFKYEE